MRRTDKALVCETDNRRKNITTDVPSSREKVLPRIFPARSSCPAPLAIEKSGVPPVPKRKVSAAIRVVSGNTRPIPVNAMLSAPGRCPI